MIIYKELANIVPKHQNAVLVIGNFDGIHTGHQQLIERARATANEMNAPLGLLTFEPHPRELFRPDDPPFRITPEPVKMRRLKKCGLDFVTALTFDWNFASQSPEAFIETVLIHGLAPAHIFIGYDFRFGQMRKGSHVDLTKAGFEVTVVDEITDDNGNSFSSSAIRSCLRHGHLEDANKMLGWDWEIEGTVFKGDQRGRELGYPTANMKLEKTIHPAYGVYASLVQILEDGDNSQWYPAATNIGIRPMFEVPTGQVEAYLLDFDGDLYDKTLRVRPVQHLRGEAKFDSLDDLIRQMDEDVGNTVEILKNLHLT